MLFPIQLSRYMSKYFALLESKLHLDGLNFDFLFF